MKLIPVKEFLSTDSEIHSFLIGISEVLCPWPPRIRIPSPSKGEGQGEDDNPDSVIRNEYHYYLFGRAMGVIAWLIIAKIIQEAFF